MLRSATISFIAPRREQTTGVPQAIASAITIGKPSYQTLGTTTKRALFMAAIVSVRERDPRKVTFANVALPDMVLAATARSGPSPMICSGHRDGEAFPRPEERV